MYFQIAVSYRVGVTTVHRIVARVCKALWNALQPEYLPHPTSDTWKSSAEAFEAAWQMPHCCGAIDSKHVVTECPANSGSLYYNYKGTFKIVLLAVVDSNYCFIVVDIGNYGRNSDGGIFAKSTFGQALLQAQVPLPSPSPLLNAPELGNVPYFLVGDEAFPLKSCLMRPFPGRSLNKEQRVFNYRLSRARRVVENAFGILAMRWRIYRRACNLTPDHVESVVKATVTLQNYLQRQSSTANTSCSSDAGENEPRSVDQPDDVTSSALSDLAGLSRSKATKQAMEVRQKLAQYFGTSGSMPWQQRIVDRAE